MTELSELRMRMDETDRRLAELFAERMAITAEIAAVKQGSGLPVRDGRREEEVLRNVSEAVPEELRADVRKLYAEILALSRGYQERLKGRNLRCGLLGETLGHSLSPRIHAALAGYEYKLYEKTPEEVEAFVREGDWDGLNVTIPYKKTVLPLCGELSETARRTGSVNTLLRLPDGRIRGENTDVCGFRTLLQRAGIPVRGRKVLVLGSGGGAAAVCEALAQEEAGEVVVISRSGENNYSNLDRHADAEILVNATPVGMFPRTGVSPVVPDRFPRLAAAVDLIYNPAETLFLWMARERGIRTVNGLTMLVFQALASAELFLGEKLPEEKAEAILEELEEEMGGAERNGKKRILVLNGPNLNLLGIREPAVYGTQTYADLEAFIRQAAAEAGVEAEIFQTNHEGVLVDRIQAARGFFDGIVINPAAYTHTSIAILDALKAVGLPAAEVHLSDIANREPFRRVSYAGQACGKTFAGLGFEGYRQAIRYLADAAGEKTV